MTASELHLKEKKPLEQGEEETREGVYFSPDVDIFERQDALVLKADVPGTSKEAIELDLNDDTLSLTATVSTVRDKWKPIYQEYEIGHFKRQFRIGHMVDKARISAEVKDGVLTITLPKVEKAQPRKIQVTSGD